MSGDPSQIYEDTANQWVSCIESFLLTASDALGNSVISSAGASVLQESLVSLFTTATLHSDPVYFSSGLISAITSYVQLCILETTITPPGVGISNIVTLVAGAPIAIPALIAVVSIPTTSTRTQAEAIAGVITTLVMSAVTTLMYTPPPPASVPVPIVQSLL